ncbi:MAG TPA: ABC transporter permease [Planctomycetota bacterium]|nr:ABC transporter permease [Planctomycetota bacterium]
MNSERFRHRLDLIAVFTQKEIKTRYRGTVLGYLWSLAHPLAFVAVFFLAFKTVMKVPVEDYALFLAAGLFPWQWFSNSLISASTVFVGNAALLRKAAFPRNLLPLAVVLQNMAHFLLSLPAIVLLLGLHGRAPSAAWLYGVPLAAAAQFLVTYGLALAVSSANVYLRDLERLTGLAVWVLLYLTPVLYRESMIPDRYRWIVHANPMAPVTIVWRNVLLEGGVPWAPLLLGLAHGTALAAVGHAVYRRLSWRIAELV